MRQGLGDVPCWQASSCQDKLLPIGLQTAAPPPHPPPPAPSHAFLHQTGSGSGTPFAQANSWHAMGSVGTGMSRPPPAGQGQFPPAGAVSPFGLHMGNNRSAAGGAVNQVHVPHSSSAGNVPTWLQKHGHGQRQGDSGMGAHVEHRQAQSHTAMANTSMISGNQSKAFDVAQIRPSNIVLSAADIGLSRRVAGNNDDDDDDEKVSHSSRADSAKVEHASPSRADTIGQGVSASSSCAEVDFFGISERPPELHVFDVPSMCYEKFGFISETPPVV